MRILYRILLCMSFGCVGCEKGDAQVTYSFQQDYFSNETVLEANDIVLDIGWVFLVDTAFKDLVLTEPKVENLDMDCYQVFLSREGANNTVSFLSKIDPILSSEDNGEVIDFDSNSDRCGPAITYLFNNSGKLLEKIYMR